MKINRFQFVLSFSNDPEIILSGGGIFVKLKERLKANLVNLNIPSNAPLETPRIVINSPDVVIQISFNRFSFLVNVPMQINNNIDASLDYLNLKLDSLLKELYPIIKKYEWCGLVATIDNPIDHSGKNSLEVSKSIFDRITTITRKNRDLSAFQMQFGYKGIEFNDIFIVNGYENKDIKLPKDFKFINGQSFQVDVDKLPVTESGLQITLDTNNKINRSIQTLPDEDFKKIIKHQKAIISTLPEELNLKGVIHG